MEHETGSIIFAFTFLTILAAVIYLISKKIPQISFAFLLFFVGLILGTLNIPIFEPIRLTPEIVLFIYLPLLLFESALHFDFQEFKRVLTPAFLLATIGLVLAAVIVAIPLHLLFALPLEQTLLFGFIIASTDPIAVLSIFKFLGVPNKLRLLVDGESFMNDATSVIAYRLMLGILAAGTGAELSLQFLGEQMLEFVYVMVAGIAIGLALGWISSEIISFISDEATIETSITLVLPILVFLISEEILHASGIMAVLAAGLTLGNYGRLKISASTHHFLQHTWEQISFLVVAIVFVLIGYEIEFSVIQDNLALVVVAVTTLLLGRFVGVYAILGLFNRSVVQSDRIPFSWFSIVNVGGVRGVLPLIILVSLPDELVTYKELFIQLSLMAILFTFVVNTNLITLIIKRSRLHLPDEIESLEQKLAEVLIIKHMLRRISKLEEGEELCNDTCERHKLDLKEQLLEKKEQIEKILDGYKLNKKDVISNVLKKYLLQLERSTYTHLYERGVLDVHILEKLDQSLLRQLDKLETQQTQFTEKRSNLEGKISSLYKLDISIFRLIKQLVTMRRASTITDIYLYYRARVHGDKRVLAEIDFILEHNTDEIIKNTLVEVRQTYQRLHDENSERLDYLLQKYPEATATVEEKVYDYEFTSLKRSLVSELNDEHRFSERALQLV